MNYKLIILILVVAFFLGATHQLKAFDNVTQHKIEEQIWALEEVYIANHRDGNIDGIIPIWHDKFLGWPDNLPHPANKKGVIKYTKQRITFPGSWDFKIERKGIQIYGNIVVNHYLLHISGRTTRVIHTWVKENTQWKILGGMSNRL